MKRSLYGVSIMTMAGLYGLLAAILILAAVIIDFPITIALLVSMITLVIQFIIAPWLTDLTMRWFYKVNFKTSTVPEYLDRFINDVCTKHNMKRPKIGIINDGAPNAFTYGRTKNDARLVLTRGIFELLNEDEVISVVGHEMGHIVHYDMLFMTFVQLVPLLLYYVYEVCLNSGSSDSDGAKNAAAVGIIAYVLYIVSQYIILWLSRTREYYADEFSYQTTKNPNAMQTALIKVGFGLSIATSSKEQRSTKNLGALGIFDSKTSKALIVETNNDITDTDAVKNAMKWEMWNPWAKVYELNSTHPLISKRLTMISKSCKDYGQKPYVEFDLEKKESYVGNFLLELLIVIMPYIILLGTGITMMCFAINSDDTNIWKLIAGIGLILLTISLFIIFKRSHRGKNFQKVTVRDLLGVVNVSGVTAVPCEVEGKIIGKGDPGCIFSEDYIVKDKTGIVFVDYNQPLTLLNKIFAIFKSAKYVDQDVIIRGWYRRNPTPFIEIYEWEALGEHKKIYTYKTKLVLYVLMFLIGIAGIIWYFI